MVNVLLKKYAFALFEVAKKEDKLPDLCQDINFFAKEFVKLKPILKTLHLESLDKSKQTEILTVILQNIKIGKLLSNFIAILVERGQINLLEDLLQNWLELQKEFDGYEKVEIITAEPLLEEQENAIKAQLQKILGEKFFIEKKVDESIIAGLIVRGKDFEFNDSILGKLNNISKNIKGALFNE